MGTLLEAVDLVAQTAAVDATLYAALFPKENPSASAIVGGVVAGETALVTGALVLKQDIQNGAGGLKILGDGITLIGDGVLIASSILAQSTNPAAKRLV